MPRTSTGLSSARWTRAARRSITPFSRQRAANSRLTPDRAISLEELCAQLQGKQQPITVLGDGGVLCYRYLEEHGVKCSLAPSMLLYQSAVGVGLAAERAYACGEAVSAQELLPVYLRPAQAERLRSSKLNQ